MTESKKQECPVMITEADAYLFAQGTHYEIYEKMGAHEAEVDGQKGVYFAVWAPNAKYVNVIGSFNNWDIFKDNMERISDGGIFALFIPDAKVGDMYKYVITTSDDRKLYKADPYGNYAQLRPDNASIVTDLSGFKWTDTVWQTEKQTKDVLKQPMAIYECHIGSWMKHPVSDPEKETGFYNYREFADRFVEYCKDMKYTHVELMGIAEHPFDGSWGYQVTGYYAPTSRYGTPEDFMYLVNTLHKHHIGVILDWVPAHFPKDEFGLANFDGTCLYEHPDARRGEHPDWGTKIFNYGRHEVSNFLIANAMFWINKFHIDGLRVDAVASMLYLDYGRENGQWLPNEFGNNKNLDAIEFFRHLNSMMKKKYPGTMMIAEESTAWPLVTGDPKEGGLGFTFKWNMGWMHDFCSYMKLDPIFRKDNHYKMTFAMSYNESENYILPLSHDEVVHLKCSMLNKMPGFYKDKFANLRIGYTYMFTHCGKKLLFMGQDFGQDCEWSEERELEWHYLEDKEHSSMKYYTQKLLEIYNKYPCLSENDNNWKSFEWINADDKDRSIYSYVRKSENGRNNILVVLNMTPMERKDYQVGVDKKKKYKLLLNSDDVDFGGNGAVIPKEITAKAVECDNRPYSLTFDLPAYGAALFLF
ncbi:1,4-alpha-glucan branching protein GlgB [Kineothrix sp. MSJ-39]|uniref:1,4-alpha-glucan branching protein GlgB n=1 Tax=Kineothrix sp. MSJ-39 TaxID=2841533 RepID=UPI001C121066|nr:1,4-alpha-glucan branching protein GlgB [Kineothrix sp. MSJ-39]MBU5429044.1 1,4-alpha-glucan branching protein GlgB [Kineothrix sp. MSJ-39]